MPPIFQRAFQGGGEERTYLCFGIGGTQGGGEGAADFPTNAIGRRRRPYSYSLRSPGDAQGGGEGIAGLRSPRPQGGGEGLRRIRMRRHQGGGRRRRESSDNLGRRRRCLKLYLCSAGFGGSGLAALACDPAGQRKLFAHVTDQSGFEACDFLCESHIAFLRLSAGASGTLSCLGSAAGVWCPPPGVSVSMAACAVVLRIKINICCRCTIRPSFIPAMQKVHK